MYDVIVVGAGPGGSSAAAFMAQSGQHVLLVDKEYFPRDKVCGDAVGGKSLDILSRLGVTKKLMKADALQTWGITFSAPSGDQISIPFSPEWDTPAFVCKRQSFDDLVFRAAEDAGVEIWQGSEARGLLWTGDAVAGVTVARPDGKQVDVRAPLVVGADGAYSAVARGLGIDQLDKKHYVGAIRAYYEGVTGFNEGNYLEIHFVDTVIPGYFWIFPLPDGGANVGLGMPSSVLKKRNIRMRELLDQLVADRRFAPRFEGARRVGKIRGWGLPLGSRPRKMAGNGWMLVGDAASLIDPFSGEGIGNAVLSASSAADWASTARRTGDYSLSVLSGYQKEVLGLLRDELRVSHLMQKIARRKRLLNMVIRKASRSKELADTISCMFDDVGERRKLTSPLFYLRVLAA
ncbi:MAG: geranylgeranyl reductase family protein [Rhodothermales bacterium]|nr:geranylgeranyl reductase family protein [Rhodothermales bacterium]